jgi:hypothetical protein
LLFSSAHVTLAVGGFINLKLGVMPYVLKRFKFFELWAKMLHLLHDAEVTTNLITVGDNLLLLQRMVLLGIDNSYSTGPKATIYSTCTK